MAVHVVVTANIFMPHFKQYNIRVLVGMGISVGSPTGLVGNSIFYQEPHQRIQATKLSFR
ncbi:MAG TPA: hypothetical protein VGA80_03875 [Flavobacteriaceae bacterium]